ncbi:hypothetical protein [Streptomyces sp. NPDC002159]
MRVRVIPDTTRPNRPLLVLTDRGIELAMFPTPTVNPDPTALIDGEVPVQVTLDAVAALGTARSDTQRSTVLGDVTAATSEASTTGRLQAAARRALDALGDLISNTSDPGVEALGAQQELQQALLDHTPPRPDERTWTVETRRRNGSWQQYGASRDTAGDGHELFARDVNGSSGAFPLRLLSSVTAYALVAEHTPERPT